jgi:hypothetical protein
MKISISVNSLSIPGGLQNWARTVSDELLRLNHHVRENHLRYFQDFIDNKLFCGAIAIGYEDI